MTAIHEMMHVLAFSTFVYSRFIDEKGVTLGYDRLFLKYTNFEVIIYLGLILQICYETLDTILIVKA